MFFFFIPHDLRLLVLRFLGSIFMWSGAVTIPLVYFFWLGHSLFLFFSIILPIFDLTGFPSFLCVCVCWLFLLIYFLDMCVALFLCHKIRTNSYFPCIFPDLALVFITSIFRLNIFWTLQFFIFLENQWVNPRKGYPSRSLF